MAEAHTLPASRRVTESKLLLSKLAAVAKAQEVIENTDARFLGKKDNRRESSKKEESGGYSCQTVIPGPCDSCASFSWA